MKHFDVNAEHAILAAAMSWPGALDRIADQLRAEDFAVRSHSAIYRACLGLHLAGHPIDPLTVRDALKATAPHIELSEINDIAQSLTSRNSVPRYVEIVREMAASRALLEAIDSAVEIADEPVPSAERTERIAALFSGLSRGTSNGKGPRRLADILVSRIDHYTALSEGDVASAWSTGILDLDRLLSGGLRPGKVYVLAARPKVGKSSLAQQIGTELAKRGLPSLVLSQEMGIEEVADRSVANVGRVPLSFLMNPAPDGSDCEDVRREKNEHWGRICEGVEIGSKLPMWIDDQGALTLPEIRSKARSIKGLKVLAIDYLQLCSSTGKRQQNRNADIEEISRGVKALAKELDIAVIALSQLNRNVESRADKRPNLSDLRDSGAIEQDADAIIFLWPVRDVQDGRRLIGCSVEANRSGPCGSFGLDFDGRYQRWAQSAEDIRPVNIPQVRSSKTFAD